MAQIEEGLALLAQEDLSEIAPVQLGVDIKRIRGVVDRAEVQCARPLEVFDRECGYASTPDTSTVSWLRNQCNLSGATADKHVKLARQLPDLEETQKALDAGQIGMEHALEIARATDDLGPGAEGELLAAAGTKDPPSSARPPERCGTVSTPRAWRASRWSSGASAGCTSTSCPTG